MKCENNIKGQAGGEKPQASGSGLVVTSQDANSAPSRPLHTLLAVCTGSGHSAHPSFGSLR